jgi:RNA polymerase sigma-70 factor (ECF subfamily)
MESNQQFVTMVRETHSSLRFFIRSLGVRSAWVDDIAQDTYLIAYKRFQKLDDPANAIFWLRAIARNLVMNELAKNARRKRLLDENLTTILLQSEELLSDHTSLADRETTQATLHKCLKGLTPRSQEIIRARYFENKKSNEIGHRFALSSSAVRKVLFQARKSLARCLQDSAITSSQL